MVSSARGPAPSLQVPGRFLDLAAWKFSRFGPFHSWACASSYSSPLPLPHPTPGGSGASHPPAPARKLPPEPAQAPGRTFLPGRRSECGAVDYRVQAAEQRHLALGPASRQNARFKGLRSGRKRLPLVI